MVRADVKRVWEFTGQEIGRVQGRRAVRGARSGWVLDFGCWRSRTMMIRGHLWFTGTGQGSYEEGRLVESVFGGKTE